MSARIALISGTAVTNGLLWYSYARMRASTADFGRVARSQHVYFLVAAAVAYACNLAFVWRLASSRRASTGVLWTAAACVVIYYLLQLLFLPAVRAALRHGASRNYARALLIACIAPVVVLAGLGVQMRSAVLTVLGCIVALHVTLNDAILYGFAF